METLGDETYGDLLGTAPFSAAVFSELPLPTVSGGTARDRRSFIDVGERVGSRNCGHF